MVDDFLEAIQRPISSPRLHSYGTPSDELATKLLNYFWNIELSQAFYPLLQAYEVALHNTIHHTLSDHFETEWWFDLPQVLGQDQLETVAEAKADLERKNKILTSGRLVAELMFGFWTSLLNRPFEEPLWHTGRPILLLSAFPNLPKHRRTLRAVYDRTQLANTLRNRIFHYEPIWNRPTLQADHDHILEALGWISTEIHEAVTFYDRFNDVYGRGSDRSRQALWHHLDLEP
ncbi:MAG TPA: hypothetical protein VGR29_12760 [Thermomicrobiales bacterium]|nr:hypothetical protein [Thermomicrobiales bacterium]